MKNEYLDMIKQFYAKRRRIPSYSEMKDLFNIQSSNAIAWMVLQWINAGILIRENYRLVPTHKFFELPLLGTIKAGFPSPEQQYEMDSVSLDQYLIGNPGFAYLLRVSGDSMINEGINSGDLVILDKRREPKNGDIVAANVDNEWTLKYFFKEVDGVKLIAANPKYSPILPKEKLEIGGVVVSVIRKYY